MSLNEPLDLKRQPKERRSEPERTAKKHAKNKRQKSKRAASPTSSYLSMRTDWSIDPPTNFKDGDAFPLHSRTKRRRETSPVSSYISLKSDNPMNVSKASESDLRAASPTPTYLSLGTDWSIDPPTNFKTADRFPLDPRLLTEQHLRCPVCKSLLKDPVSIPCGHNYCSGCINAFWDTCAGEYVCPHCGKASETRPVLNTNAALAEVVKNIQQAGFSPALPPQSYAGPEDVACDLCSERRLKSVKSCSTCGVSLCETHVRQHYTVPALQKHTLCDVTGDIKMRPSQQQENTDNFNSSASGQQQGADKTQDVIKCPEFSDAATPVTDEPEPTTIIAAVRKETESGIVPEPKDESNQEMAVATKLQTRLKRSAKTFRPKTKEKKENIKRLALICSTLQQEMSGLREKLSELETKNTKKEKYEDEEDYGEEDEVEEDDDYGEEDKEEYEEGDDDYGDVDEEEYDEEDYGEEEEKDDGDDSVDYSEKDFDAENDEEESDEHSFDEEDGYEDDYEEEDDSKEDKDVEDYYDEDNSEEDSDKDSYDSNYY